MFDNTGKFSASFNQLQILIIAGLCATAIFPLQHGQLQKQTSRIHLSLTQIEKSVKTEALSLKLLTRLPSLGFDNLMANWTFLRFLQYFGDDEVRQKRTIASALNTLRRLSIATRYLPISITTYSLASRFTTVSLKRQSS